MPSRWQHLPVGTIPVAVGGHLIGQDGLQLPQGDDAVVDRGLVESGRSRDRLAGIEQRLRAARCRSGRRSGPARARPCSGARPGARASLRPRTAAPRARGRPLAWPARSLAELRGPRGLRRAAGAAGRRSGPARAGLPRSQLRFGGAVDRRQVLHWLRRRLWRLGDGRRRFGRSRRHLHDPRFGGYVQGLGLRLAKRRTACEWVFGGEHGHPYFLEDRLDLSFEDAYFLFEGGEVRLHCVPLRSLKLARPGGASLPKTPARGSPGQGQNRFSGAASPCRAEPA